MALAKFAELGAELNDNFLVSTDGDGSVETIKISGAITKHTHVRVVESYLFNSYRNGVREIILDCTSIDHLNSTVFPEMAVTLAALMDSFRSDGAMTILPVLSEDPNQKRQAAWFEKNTFSPMSISEAESRNSDQVLGSVWRVDGDHSRAFYGQGGLWSKIQTAMFTSLTFDPGWFDVFEWIVGELLDNIARHSMRGYGFFCTQINRNFGSVDVAIADNGQGILRSFRYTDGLGFIRDDLSAITKAFEKGVTRDPTIGKGWGLYGTSQMARNTAGSITVSSGIGHVRLWGQREPQMQKMKHGMFRLPGTVIDVNLPVRSGSINPSDVTGTSAGGLFWEQFESSSPTEDPDTAVVLATEYFPGYGSRSAGELARNQVVNLLNKFERVLIDFDGVPVVVASFADELFGKLMLELGSAELLKSRVIIRNASDFIRNQVTTSLEGRTAELSVDEKVE